MRMHQSLQMGGRLIRWGLEHMLGIRQFFIVDWFRISYVIPSYGYPVGPMCWSWRYSRDINANNISNSNQSQKCRQSSGT